jgi:putative membrane protein
MMAMWSAVWVVAVVAITWAVISIARSDRPRAGSGDAPEEILDRRLARGELDVEEYERLRGALNAHR